MIEIKQVVTKKDVKKFATFPLKLYKGCPYYVPSLRLDEMNTFNPKKNNALKTNKIKGFLCYKDGELVGRIAGIINYQDNDITGEKQIRFSRFECIDDIEVFKALLGAVENMAKEEGMEIMHGPWGFNDTDREGMLTFGFDKRSTYAENYYYPYFQERMRELGYEDESKWIEMSFTIPETPYDRIVSFAEKVRSKFNVKDVSETMSVKQIIKKYGDSLIDCLNESYSHLDAYVPVDEGMKKDLFSSFGAVVNRKYISILVDENEKVVAFGICLPSICNALQKSKGKLLPFGIFRLLKAVKKPKELEMALIGVRKEYKNTGINSLLIAKIMKYIVADGIEHIESNSMLEHNFNIQQQWKFAESEIIKKRQTFKKKVGA